MNKLYLESLRSSTDGEWELIVIDNGSTDGSLEFFRNAGPNVRVIANDGNYSYPYCQNQGTAIARGDILAYFNNDILLSPHWDTRMRQMLGHEGREVLTLGATERMGDAKSTSRQSHRWKRIKYPMMKLFGSGRRALRMMVKLMYGNWNAYADKMWEREGTHLREGFVGSAVVMTRRGLELLGDFDPTVQAADFDLYFRSLHRHHTKGDIRPMAVMGGVLHHHYGRLTLTAKYPPFKDAANLRSLQDKWGPELTARYFATLS